MYAPQPRLPAELTDMVIDQLHSSQRALAAAALVCQSWLPRSRVHLFRRVAVTGEFHALLRFLQCTPHVRGYVRHLVLQGRASEDKCAPRLQTTLPPHLLAELLSQLPRLRTLQLHGVAFHEHRPSRLPPYPLHTLDELTLMNVGSAWDTTDDVLSVLGLFSEIKFLHLNSIAQVVGAPPRHPPLAPAHIRVHALKFEDVPSDVYFELMRGTRSRGALRSIEAECADAEDAAALAALLHDAGAALEHLALDLTHEWHFSPGEQRAVQEALRAWHERGLLHVGF
ncbi:hypothetical protein PHLGIDRAFT_36787 [Phlebiopsis gigantea 11061_1 CR5-6]|uniref:F-box domain-containing protein n=1 Tax=Phlebiopsis gigantea (strain 11061_1 CR5-6) TaxID=745531 RepID=A0A0C3S3X9_PHLG1|nr:hypothetical protein PHLGIDRAFT_36787 [Phlebiopsis gigantea 11061_1 CR5-6]